MIMNSTYGVRLRELREKLGYIQVDFCKKFAITRSTLVNYESGRTFFDVEFLDRLCRAHDVNVAWLVTGQGEMLNSKDDKATNPDYLATLLYGEEGTSKDIREILLALKEKILRSEMIIALEIAKDKYKEYFSSKKPNGESLEEVS